jgi:hypothetical protein
MRRHKLRKRYGRAASKGGLRLLYRSPTGARVWALPDSRLQVMWSGTGARLRIGFDFLTAGGNMGTTIDHPSASDSYNTPREAEAAVRAFVRSGS